MKKQKKPGRRRLSRELALQILYAMEITGYDIDKTIQYFLFAEIQKEIGLKPSGNQDLNPFTEHLVRTVLDHGKDIDTDLQKVIRNWKLDRLSRIDRNLLRLAAAELYYFEDIPPKVTINEYIEMAKEFGDDDSPSFINGILDQIAKEFKKRDNGAGGGT